MQFKLVLSLGLSVLLAPQVGVVADLCALGAQEIGGNYFCQAVDSIQYSNVGTPGSYNRVVYM